MPGRRVIAVGVLLAVSMVTACSSASTARGAVETTTSTALPVTTVTVATTTTAVVAPRPRPSPDRAAAALLDAWNTRNRDAALAVALPRAVDTLFGRAPTTVSPRGCQDPISDTSDCAFRGAAGLIVVHTVATGGGWIVDSVSLDG
jgi:hypothetical protein